MSSETPYSVPPAGLPPPTWVDSPTSFEIMVADLSKQPRIAVDKRHQKADWAARPLTPSQIDYARLDTHYLFQLRDILEKELEEKDRLKLAQEDFARATKVEQPRE